MYKLVSLPYSYGALEPYIEAQIMELHHSKHQQAYVDGLNAALQNFPELEKKPLIDLLKDLNSVPESIRTAVRNHGGGVENHMFFWDCMMPKGGGHPRGPVAQGIKESFGTFDAFQDQLNSAAKSRFGSGWAWLVLNNQGRLVVMSTANQDSPISEGLTPVLGIDVWEHAYYLQYFNRRADYVTAWWHLVNWEKVEERYHLLVG